VNFLIRKFTDLHKDIYKHGSHHSYLIYIVEFLSSLDLCFPGEDKIKNIINKKYYDYANCGWVYDLI